VCIGFICGFIIFMSYFSYVVAHLEQDFVEEANEIDEI
jgi:hypothetical protein